MVMRLTDRRPSCDQTSRSEKSRGSRCRGASAGDLSGADRCDTERFVVLIYAPSKVPFFRRRQGNTRPARATEGLTSAGSTVSMRQRCRSFAAGSRVGKLLSAANPAAPAVAYGFSLGRLSAELGLGLFRLGGSRLDEGAADTRCEQLPASLRIDALTVGSRSTPLARRCRQTGGGRAARAG